MGERVSASRQLRIACLGITHPHASTRVKVFRELEGVTLADAADDDERAGSFCKLYGLRERRVTDLLEDPGIDALLIHATGRRLGEYALAAVEHGKAVLVEKTGGSDPENIEPVVRAAEARGLVAAVGYNCRLARSVQQARSVLRSGVIGRVVSVNAHAGAMAGAHTSELLNDPADLGGGLWIIGCHVIDIILATCGLPASVNARVSKYADLSGADSREDGAAVIMNYPGLQAVYDFSVHDPHEWYQTHRITYFGERGTLSVGIIPQWYELHLEAPAQDVPAGITRWRESSFPVPWVRPDAQSNTEFLELANTSFFYPEAAAFVAAVREGEPPPVTMRDALNVARVVRACYQSSALGGAAVDVR
jgi:predicted dehydrogenase